MSRDLEKTCCKQFCDCATPVVDREASCESASRLRRMADELGESEKKFQKSLEEPRATLQRIANRK